jgi:hypothetical protein
VVLCSAYVLLVNLVSEKFAKKLLGKNEIEDVLRRLDRLTLDEARITGTHTLQLVNDLVINMKLVMSGQNGTQLSLDLKSIAHRIIVL